MSTWTYEIQSLARQYCAGDTTALDDLAAYLSEIDRVKQMFRDAGYGPGPLEAMAHRIVQQFQEEGHPYYDELLSPISEALQNVTVVLALTQQAVRVVELSRTHQGDRVQIPYVSSPVDPNAIHAKLEHEIVELSLLGHSSGWSLWLGYGPKTNTLVIRKP